jgi:Flp pilus assembly protein TadG
LLNRRAAAATEFAILLPLLLAFALAGVDLGRALWTAMVLDHAARVGAERGATRGYSGYTQAAWKADVEAHVRDDLLDLGPAASAAQIEVAVTPLADDLFRVQVAVTGQVTLVVDWPFLPAGMNLRREAYFCRFR